MGVTFDQATKGPFAQFQNSGDDEDSLTKLVLQLIRRNSDAEPREEAVRRQVNAFRDGIGKFAPSKPAVKATESEVDTNGVAKLFEEIKVMFRDLPERLQGQIRESLGPRSRKRRRLHPRMLMDMMHHSDIDDPSTGWLMVISNFKDEAPWLYEVGLDVYRALQKRDRLQLEKAIDRLERVLETVRRGPLSEMMIDSEEVNMAVHELGRMAHHLFLSEARLPPARRVTKSKTKVNAETN